MTERVHPELRVPHLACPLTDPDDEDGCDYVVSVAHERTGDVAAAVVWTYSPRAALFRAWDDGRTVGGRKVLDDDLFGGDAHSLAFAGADPDRGYGGRRRDGGDVVYDGAMISWPVADGHEVRVRTLEEWT